MKRNPIVETDGPRSVMSPARPRSGRGPRSGVGGDRSCRVPAMGEDEDEKNSKTVAEARVGLATVGGDAFGRAFLASGDVRATEDRLPPTAVLGVAPERSPAEGRL